VSIRLNKLLATRGIGARRKCDEMIKAGEVRVNGKVVTEPGCQIEPDRDDVQVRGRPLPRPATLRYFALHKPVGVISTLEDPEGRRSLKEFLPPGARMFPVGRLDADTSGLIVLTNDGELAHHLMHPRYGVSKRYRVHVDRIPSEHMLQRLQRGIEFEPGVVSAPAQVWVRDRTPGDSVLEFALHEGRHRQVRRMCEAAGLDVKRLHRWAYGPLRLGELARGMYRELSDDEVAELRAASARPVPRQAGAGLTGQRSFDRARQRLGPRPRSRESVAPRPPTSGLAAPRPGAPATPRPRPAGRGGSRAREGVPSRFGARSGPRTREGAPSQFRERTTPRTREGAPPRFRSADRGAPGPGPRRRPVAPVSSGPPRRPPSPIAERGASGGARERSRPPRERAGSARERERGPRDLVRAPRGSQLGPRPRRGAGRVGGLPSERGPSRFPGRGPAPSRAGSGGPNGPRPARGRSMGRPAPAGRSRPLRGPQLGAPRRPRRPTS
jgi:pseudouridine synthase